MPLNRAVFNFVFRLVNYPNHFPFRGIPASILKCVRFRRKSGEVYLDKTLDPFAFDRESESTQYVHFRQIHRPKCKRIVTPKQITLNSLPQNENSVIIYSLSSCSKKPTRQ